MLKYRKTGANRVCMGPNCENIISTDRKEMQQQKRYCSDFCRQKANRERSKLLNGK